MCAALSLTLAAAAQSDPLHDAGPYSYPINRRTLDRCADLLQLDPEQKAAARELHEAYRGQFKEATAQAQAAQKRIRDAGGTSVNQEQAQVALAFVEESQRLRDQLLSDLESICTPAQLEQAPAMRRFQRRNSGNRFALVAGEDVELPALLESLRIARTPELAEILQRWELDVDRLQQEKERVILAALPTLVDPEPRPERLKVAQELVRQMQLVGGQMRDRHRKAIREMLPLLEESRRAELEQQVRITTFPKIFAPSSVHAALETAGKLENLSAEQRTQLQEISSRYERELLAVNIRWAAAAEEKQMQFAAMMANPDLAQGQDQFTEIAAEREQLDERYYGRIATLLNADQRELLPPLRKRTGSPEYLPSIEERLEGELQEWREDK